MKGGFFVNSFLRNFKPTVVPLEARFFNTRSRHPRIVYKTLAEKKMDQGAGSVSAPSSSGAVLEGFG